jgi:hypothetical protein
MPGQRKEGKRLWGGYLDEERFDKLDVEARRRGFATRTDFLNWISDNCDKCPPDSLAKKPKPGGKFNN